MLKYPLKEKKGQPPPGSRARWQGLLKSHFRVMSLTLKEAGQIVLALQIRA